MFKSFALIAFAGVVEARGRKSRQSYSAKYESDQPYSTSYNDPAKSSCHIAPYKPDKIKRARMGSAERGVGQYRSVNWGKDGCYADWRDIDVLDQPAAYEKPSYTNTLVQPNQVYNTYESSNDYTEYGGYGGLKRRSDGIDYSKQVFKRTACNGLRKDTLSTEYEHTDEPSTCVTQYVEPKPWQCYEAPKSYKKVKGVRGTEKVGYDDPLMYPKYKSKTYHYEKPVIQDYDVTKTCKKNPKYIDYEAPHYNFLEYDLYPQDKIAPTYYKAPEVYGEESYGYVPETYKKQQKEYPVGYGGEYNDYYAEPMKVKPRYPTKEVKTYDKQVVKKTQLQPSRYESAPVDHHLVPAYEKPQYNKPKYAPKRPKKQNYGSDVYETPYAPKSKSQYPKQKYAEPKYEAVKTNYYPTATKAPYDYSVDYSCKSCGY